MFTLTKNQLDSIKALALIMVVVFFISPKTTQAVMESTLGGTLVANINPKYPKPGDVVNIKLSTYGYSLENSKISWFVNQKLELEGMAKKEHVVTMGPNGSQTAITILVENSARKQIVKNLTFRPADVDLIWQADTYIPDEYKGATLPSLNSKVTITAVPNLKENGFSIPSDELIFTWIKDYKTILTESGRGKDSFVFNLDQPSTQIEVLVQSPDFKIEAYNKAVIRAHQPELVLYPIKPLLDRVLEALGPSFAITSDMSGLQVEPYFTPMNMIKQNSIRYDWLNSGQPIISSSKNSISLSQLSDQEKNNLSIVLYSRVEDSVLAKQNWQVVLNRQNPFFGR